MAMMFDPVDLTQSMRRGVEYMKVLALRDGVRLDDQGAVMLSLWVTRLIAAGDPPGVAWERALIISAGDLAENDDIENEIIQAMKGQGDV